MHIFLKHTQQRNITLKTARIVSRPPAYTGFLNWLLFAGLLTIAGYLSVQSGLLAPVLDTDSTYISILIVVLFTLGSIHSGWRLWSIARESQRLLQLEQQFKAAGIAVLDQVPGFTASYCRAIVAQYRSESQTDNQTKRPSATELAAILGEQARRQHAYGWFLAGTLIKIGLLGTVIGFILMLRSIEVIESFDVTDVQRIMTLMSTGMGVALYTTLVGLISSVLLGIQYLAADQSANRLVALTVEFAERELRLA